MYKEEKFTTFSNEKTHMNVDILDRLEDYCGKDYVPMHMPGAKRNTDLFKMGNPYGLDITEIDGFDNMHHATDIIKEAIKSRYSRGGRYRFYMNTCFFIYYLLVE